MGLDLHPCRLQVEAYQLPFDPSGSMVFGPVFAEVLAKNEDWTSQKCQKALEVALAKVVAPRRQRPEPIQGKQGKRKQVPT